jgi:hypothetical protein
MDEQAKPCVKCGVADRNTRGECKPCKSERNRKWREVNQEHCAEYRRGWVEANRERQRKYREENKEHIVEYQRKWAAANSGRVAEHQRKWAQANSDRRMVHRQNRRALKKRNGGKLSKGITQTLLILQKNKCACCGYSLENGYHLDHIWPLALGGKNVDSNVQLLTPICNMRKGAMHPDDWARKKGKTPQ